MGSTVTSSWHNENKGVLMINKKKRKYQIIPGENKKDDSSSEKDDEREEDLEKELERQLNFERKRCSNEKAGKVQNAMEMEIDFETFEMQFWPRVCKGKPTEINSIVAWTEIFSTIKGSALSYLNPGNYLTSKQYLSNGNNSITLNDEVRKEIFNIFLLYEKWKESMGYYDLMDLVNHQLKEISNFGYNGSPIHYLMVDEVQDLPHNILLLLSNVTEQKLYFAGDTAQSITKGVGGRFCDLVNVFRAKNLASLELEPPIVKQLSRNFRSHARILNLSNSVISLLEVFFPETIDKMKKEKSDLEGPKPMIMNDNNLKNLFLLLTGSSLFNQRSIFETPVEFGCSQVILVRDQESKKKIPNTFKHALCLTVYESKGLEFDDVILFNFFSSSNIKRNKWKILEYLAEKEVYYTKEEFTNMISCHKSKCEARLYEEDFSIYDAEEDKDGNIRTKNIYLDHSYDLHETRKNCMILCDEFKLLYTAITRPKKRLIIYDDDDENRKVIQNFWRKLDLVSFIDLNESKSQDPNSSFEKILIKNEPEQWRAQGIKMFRNKFYEQAAKCFSKSGDNPMRDRANAYFIADKGIKGLSQIDAEIENKNGKIKKLEKEDFQKRKKECYDDLLEAARLFELIGLKKKAAQCYFSGLKLEMAKKLFLELELWIQAGESSYLLNEFEEACLLFEKGQDYSQLIKTLESMKEYERLLDKLHQYQDYFDHRIRIERIQKIFPLIFEAREPKQNKDISIDDINDSLKEESSEESEEEKKSINDNPSHKTNIIYNEEEKINSFTIVMENQCNEDYSKIDKFETKKSISSEEENKESHSIIEIIENIERNQNQNSFSILAEKDNSKQSNSNQSYEKLMDINLSSSNQNDSQLSNTGSISSIQLDSSMNFNSNSEFSLLENLNLIISPSEILEKGNINIEDKVLVKILKYIQLFKEDLRIFLNTLRSKESLSQFNKLFDLRRESNKINDSFERLIDFDYLDENIINLIIDTLESFNMIRLCIFVCNRYKMKGRIGKFLVSLGHEYSAIAGRNRHISKRTNPNKAFLNNSFHEIKKLLQLINSDYLKFRPSDDEMDSMPIQFYKGFLTLGFWQSIIKFLDAENALNLASTLFQYKIYDNLILEFKEQEFKTEKFFMLDEIHKIETHYHNILFEIQKENTLNKPDFETVDIKMISLEDLLNFIYSNKISKTNSEFCIPKLKERITIIKHCFVFKQFNFSNYEDLLFIIIPFLLVSMHEEYIHSLFRNLDDEIFYDLFNILSDFINIFGTISRIAPDILKCILILFNGKLLPNCKLFNHFGDNYMVIQRNSQLLSLKNIQIFPFDSFYSTYLIQTNKVIKYIRQRTLSSLKFFLYKRFQYLETSLSRRQLMELIGVQFISECLVSIVNGPKKQKEYPIIESSHTNKKLTAISTPQDIPYQIEHEIEIDNEELEEIKKESKMDSFLNCDILYSKLFWKIYDSMIIYNNFEIFNQKSKSIILHYCLSIVRDANRVKMKKNLKPLINVYIMLSRSGQLNYFNEMIQKLLNSNIRYYQRFLYLYYSGIYKEAGLISEYSECLFKFLDGLEYNEEKLIRLKIYLMEEFVVNFIMAINIKNVTLLEGQIIFYNKIRRTLSTKKLLDLIPITIYNLELILRDLEKYRKSKLKIIENHSDKIMILIFQLISVQLNSTERIDFGFFDQELIWKTVGNFKCRMNLMDKQKKSRIVRFESQDFNKFSLFPKSDRIEIFEISINEVNYYLFPKREFLNFFDIKTIYIPNHVDSIKNIELQHENRLINGKKIFDFIQTNFQKLKIKNLHSNSFSIYVKSLFSKILPEISFKIYRISNELIIFDLIKDIRKKILQTYYNTKISNSIDFQYLMIQLEKLESIQSELLDSLKLNINNLRGKKLKEKFESAFTQISLLKRQFEEWNINVEEELQTLDLENKRNSNTNIGIQKGLASKALKAAQRLAANKKKKFMENKKINLKKGNK